MSVDLSGLLYIQKDYLYDLSAIATTNPANPAAGYVLDLQRYLGTIYNDYSTAGITSQNVLNNQSQIASIVQTEQQRLEAKKSEIDNQIYSQTRLIELNNSYRKRQEAYLYIIFVLAFSLIFVVLLLKLRKIIPYPLIAEIIIILIAVFDIIYIGSLVWSIYNRELINYDNLIFKPPIDANNKSFTDSNNINQGSNGLCFGQACCVGNTVWNPYTNQCDIKCPTHIDPSTNTINFNGTWIAENSCPSGKTEVGSFCISNNLVSGNTQTFAVGITYNGSKPYEPSEYTKYGVYK